MARVKSRCVVSYLAYPAVSDQPVKEADVLEISDEVIENSPDETQEQWSAVSSDEGRAEFIPQ